MQKKVFLCLLIIFFSKSIFCTDLQTAITSPEGSQLYKMTRLWLDEITKITGITFSLNYLPMERAKVELINGEIDMDIGRSTYVYENFDEVVYSTHQTSFIEYFIFSDIKDLDYKNIDYLKTKVLIAVRGNQVIERWIKDTNISKVIYANSVDNAFKLISLNRGDYILENVLLTQIFVDPENMKGITRFKEPILNVPLYIVLNKKHKNLEPIISAAIAQIDESGKTNEIFGIK